MGTTTGQGNLLPQDGFCFLYQNVCANEVQELTPDTILETLLNDVDWQQEQVKIFGKVYTVPRYVAWYGSKAYTYSNVEHRPQPMLPVLEYLKERAQILTRQYCGDVSFNSVLCNYYKDGSHGMGWHADDEPELGVCPTIASFSFGATRAFHIRRKSSESRKNFGTLKVYLPHDSCMIMGGAMQQHWEHAVPKITGKKAAQVLPRVNLTFRYIE